MKTGTPSNSIRLSNSEPIETITPEGYTVTHYGERDFNYDSTKWRAYAWTEIVDEDEENNKKRYKIWGNTYDVIGVTTIDTPSLLDYTIFMDLDSLIKASNNINKKLHRNL